MEWKTSQKFRVMNKTPLFYCISSIFFFLSACALLSCPIRTKTTSFSAAAGGISFPLAAKADFYVQEFEMVLEKINGQEILALSKGNKRVASQKLGAGTRRFLRGPGSEPPLCTSKCGKCTPCKPVHVAVPPPGTPVTAEYYPEAWRCKCGNKLYKP